MKKEELLKLVDEQQKEIDKHKKRIKEQNQKAKELWDAVTCRLPKGTKKRITDKGLTVNGFVNAAVLEKLEEMEK